MGIDSTALSQQYHSEIVDELKAREAAGGKPTIGDMIRLQGSKGNAVFYDARPEDFKSPELRMEGFPMDNNPFHAAAHLVGKLGHTPQDERLVVLTQLGLETPQQVHYPSIDELVDADYTALETQLREKFASEKMMRQLKRPARHEEAIYYAMGAYISQKLGEYRANTPSLKRASYEDKAAFCRHYALPENHPQGYRVNRGAMLENLKSVVMDDYAVHNDFKKLPYHFLTLSRDEQKAIKDVALGMKNPEDTPYPQRMSDLKQLLVETEMFHDLGKRIGINTNNISPRQKG